jgi:hypothetical protein
MSKRSSLRRPTDVLHLAQDEVHDLTDPLDALMNAPRQKPTAFKIVGITA